MRKGGGHISANKNISIHIEIKMAVMEVAALIRERERNRELMFLARLYVCVVWDQISTQINIDRWQKARLITSSLCACPINDRQAHEMEGRRRGCSQRAAYTFGRHEQRVLRLGYTDDDHNENDGNDDYAVPRTVKSKFVKNISDGITRTLHVQGKNLTSKLLIVLIILLS